MRYAVAPGRRSGRGGAAALGARVVEQLRDQGHEVTEVVAGTLAEAHGACAALVGDGIDVLVVVGGDGVVSMGTDVCAGTGTALGIVPAGTGNDNAHSLGLPVGLPVGRSERAPDPLSAAPSGGARRRVDTLLLPELGRHVLGSVCCALDARIAARADAWPRLLGPSAYTLSALVEIALLRRQPPLEFTLQLETADEADEVDGGGRERELEALVVVAANMPYFGGGLPIAPAADPHDGVLDLVLIRPVTPPQAVGLLRAVRAGRHAEHPAVEVVRARQVRVAGPADIVAYGDGEALSSLPLTVRVAPASLEVVGLALT